MFPPNVRWNGVPSAASFNGKLENGKLTGAWRQGGGRSRWYWKETGHNEPANHPIGDGI
jgi:hypothetical protein